MPLIIPNSRGWKQREAIAKAKSEAKLDSVTIARRKLHGAIHIRDNARGDVERAEGHLATATEQLARFKGVVASYEAYSVAAFKVHPSLSRSRMDVESAEHLVTLAGAALDTARARAASAEVAFDAAHGRFIADTTDDATAADVTAPAAVEPVVSPMPVKVAIAPVAMAPSRVDDGVALDRDAALAALDAPKRGRRR